MWLVHLNDVSSSVWSLIDQLFENMLINERHWGDSLSSWKLNWAKAELLKANWRLFLYFMECWGMWSIGKVKNRSLAVIGLLIICHFHAVFIYIFGLYSTKVHWKYMALPIFFHETWNALLRVCFTALFSDDNSAQGHVTKDSVR